MARGEAAIISSVCDREATGKPINELTVTCNEENILDVQASIESARKRRAWLGKAGLGHGVVLGVECKLDDVSHSGGLKEGALSARRSM